MIKLTDILNEAENPCWKGYKQVGMKSKNGKEVPNCVPESVQEEELTEAHYTAVANLGTKKAKENLDSFDELQKFMDKMKSRKAISVQVTKINNSKKQTIDYDWDGKQWVSKNKKGVQEAGLKGTENIPLNKKLSQLSDNDKLNILQSGGNIISFHIPDWAKGRYKMWQVISAGKIKKKKDLDGEIIYFLPGKGPQKSSPTYPTLKDLLNGVDWDTMEMRRESVNESNLKGQLAGDSVQDIIKSIGSRFVSGEIKNTKRDGKTYLKLTDEKFGSGVVKILKSRFGIDSKVDYYGGKGKIVSTPSVSFYSDTILESKQLKETMIRRAVDLAQEILPKDIWSRYASNGPKNKEFVKSIVRDLTNMLNRFYKSYDVNVRIKEDILHEIVNKPQNEDLRKWFGKGKTGSSTGGGWDRYGTDGQKLGKCGEGEEGDAYAACLSKEKAEKLGPKGRAAFVKRKRADQKKAGDAKKGGESKKGQKPTFSKTGA